MSASSELARLLEHPAIWRGTSVARTEVLPTGFAALDQRLPGGGWPRSGLIEILISRFGVGELTLMLPVLAALTARPMARWCVWVAPPLEPFAPALASHGVDLERLLVVRAPAEPELARRVTRGIQSAHDTSDAPGTRRRRIPRDTGTLWAFEQSLGSGACDLVMAWSGRWPGRPRAKQIRRLQLSAERGRTLGVLFRPCQAARESSHATLRMAIEPSAYGVRLTLLKSRGGVRGSVELELRGATHALHGS
jgi:hypothetical protein